MRIFYDINELMSLANLDSYLIQEYIEDAQEYTVDCYVDRQGDILVTVPRERLEIMGGEVTRTVTRNIPELVEMSRKVFPEVEIQTYELSHAFITQGGPLCVAIQYIKR